MMDTPPIRQSIKRLSIKFGSLLFVLEKFLLRTNFSLDKQNQLTYTNIKTNRRSVLNVEDK